MVSHYAYDAEPSCLCRILEDSNPSGSAFETAAFYGIGGGLLGAPPAIITGFMDFPIVQGTIARGIPTLPRASIPWSC
jgi:hypothetical protein